MCAAPGDRDSATRGLLGLPASFPGLAFAAVSVAEVITSELAVPWVLGSLLGLGMWLRVPVPLALTVQGVEQPSRQTGEKAAGGLERDGGERLSSQGQKGVWLRRSSSSSPDPGEMCLPRVPAGSCSHCGPMEARHSASC